ncbi:MAG: urease accessory protein UreH [Deltaproteobacteria bacterium]|nr:urease accessory protein UreH [Deltaproteobacteria bacterium]
MTPLATLLLGLLLGLKHAFDSDHLIAVSTIVSRERSPWRSLWIGLFWGIGHTVTLLAVGVLVLGMKMQIPPPLESSLECAVGVMIVGLGLTTLYDWWRKRLHAHEHAHEGSAHTHFHMHASSAAHQHPHPLHVGAKPMLIGMVHGLAGSAALMLLVLTAIPSPVLGLFYIGIFGVGSVVGMGLVSLLLGVFFSLATDRFHNLNQGIRLTVGTLSTAFGLWMIVEIGFIQGFFLGLFLA